MTSSLFSPPERYVSHIIRTRATRAKFFDPKLFADPAWDILLSMYQSELRQRRVTISSCCSAAKVPATSALRCIGRLCDEGLVLRTPDPLDARRTFLSLTRESSTAMHAFLRAFEELALEDTGLRPQYRLLHEPDGGHCRDVQC